LWNGGNRVPMRVTSAALREHGFVPVSGATNGHARYYSEKGMRGLATVQNGGVISPSGYERQQS
jgi:hypothetical protein